MRKVSISTPEAEKPDHEEEREETWQLLRAVYRAETEGNPAASDRAPDEGITFPDVSC